MKSSIFKVCSVAVVLLNIEVVLGCTWSGDCYSGTKTYCCSFGSCCTFSQYYSTSKCTFNSECTSISKPYCCSGGSCCSYSVYSGSSTITTYSRYWSLSIGAIVGIVIGVIVLIVASIVGCVFCCCRPNRTNQGVVVGATATTTANPVTMPQYPGNYGYNNLAYPGQGLPPTSSTAGDPSFMPPPYPKEGAPSPY